MKALAVVIGIVFAAAMAVLAVALIFPDRFGDFLRFAKSAANAAIVIAGDDQRAETEAATAFHHFGAAIDEHDLLRRVASRGCGSVGVAGIASSACITLVCHEF